MPGCVGVPVLELVSGRRRVAMDLIYYSETTETCGYDADGDAMFNDDFRPSEVLVTADRSLAIAPGELGVVSVDIRPLEPGMRLAELAPSPGALAAASDGTFPVTLPGPGCSVVTVGWRLDRRDGQFVALAASDPAACETD